MIAEATLQDWCSILTAGAAIITAVVVAWYTKITADLQRTTHRQVEVSAQQLAQAKEQLEHAKAEAEKLRTREILDARPVFRWAFGAANGKHSMAANFLNDGGPFFEVQAIQSAGLSVFSLSPDAIIKAQETGRITLTATSEYGLSFPYAFTIEGRTRFHEWIGYKFLIDDIRRPPRLIETNVMKDASRPSAG